MPKLGAHMSITGGFHLAFDQGEKTGCETMQIFTKNNRQWKAKPITTADVDAWLERRERSSISPVFVHTIYLLNPGSPNEEVRQKSLAGLIDEVERAALLEIPWVILHPGNHGGQGHDEGVRLIGEGIRQALDATADTEVRVCLETTAGQGTSIGWRFEHLAELYEAIDAPERLCVCMDTCHIFAAGYAFDTPDAYQQTLEAFDDIVGLDKLACMHLNDSMTEFAARKDRHENIGDGTIGLEPFRAFLNDPRLADVPMVIETPVDKNDIAEDRENLSRLRNLLNP